jgi:hypothetical protein
MATTVTYNIVQNEGDIATVSSNEGYWSTSKTSSHDPASVGYTAGPSSPSLRWRAGFDRTSSKYKYKKGFVRFVNVQVPQGATITAATLKLNFLDGEDVNYTLSGFDADNPDPSSMGTSDGDHSTHTTANVTFNVPSNGSQNAMNDNLTTSPDIKDIVQELVDRSGWAAGNAMMFVFPIGSTYTSDEYRQYWTWYEDRTPKTELSITYEDGSTRKQNLSMSVLFQGLGNNFNLE